MTFVSRRAMRLRRISRQYYKVVADKNDYKAKNDNCAEIKQRKDDRR
jgi:hypothetical protein